jgi:hypothetical protein
MDMSASQNQTANAQVLDFNQDFSVRNLQQYTLLNNAWEVYVGRFVNANQDGLFLYDRSAGQARVVSFDSKLQVSHYHDMQDLAGNWEVYSGDFNGSGRAQALLYDPSSGNAQFLIFSPDLSLANQKSYSGWGTNLALYVGHFGTSTLIVMLYDPEAAKRTFVAFNNSLEVTHQYQVSIWDQRWQILVGSFVDRSRCLASGNCTTGDDILVLNRQTGQIQQYVFSFGRQYRVFDNRSQAFLREGLAANANLGPVDTTSFSLLGTLDSSIRGEELY